MHSFKLHFIPFRYFSTFIAISLSFSLFSCTTISGLSKVHETIEMPSQWQSIASDQQLPINSNESLLAQFNDDVLVELIETALLNNPTLKAQFITLQIAEQNAMINGALKYPELTLNVGQSRRKSSIGSDNSYQNNADITLQLSYELDVWGKLSDLHTQALLTFTSAKANYEQQRSELISLVASSWFNLVEANQLLILYKKRAVNLQDNLQMIQSAYKLGLNEALDVYLTQNNVSTELARVEQQQQILLSRKRSLELLLGEYPSAKIAGNETLPLIDSLTAGESIPIPSQVLTLRPDLVSAWYQLLSADASLAIAHKQRFPRISISSSIGDNSDELSNLLDGNTLIWSLIGNLSAPIFDAGRLAAQEEKARLVVQQQEQQYLAKVHESFADVENSLSNQKHLALQLHHISASASNAVTAEELSFNQYLKGIVSYTTVLESQRRAFDSQTSLIKLTNQILQNKISLYLSVGGFANNEVMQVVNSSRLENRTKS